VGFLTTPRFPDQLAAWAMGGRGFKTIPTETFGGLEYRNAAWSQMRGEWEITEPFRETNPLAPYAFKLLRDFHRISLGAWGGFRFKDFNDSTDDGAGVFVAVDSTHFQVAKRYTVGSNTFTQNVLTPISPIVVTGGSGVSVNYAIGIVTVSSGTPTAWTGAFDIPVRFAQDQPMAGLDSSGTFINWSGLKLIELKNL
jgi:uncharacterized protein (TIGR02217 family)